MKSTLLIALVLAVLPSRPAFAASRDVISAAKICQEAIRNPTNSFIYWKENTATLSGPLPLWQMRWRINQARTRSEKMDLALTYLTRTDPDFRHVDLVLRKLTPDRESEASVLLGYMEVLAAMSGSSDNEDADHVDKFIAAARRMRELTGRRIFGANLRMPRIVEKFVVARHAHLTAEQIEALVATDPAGAERMLAFNKPPARPVKSGLRLRPTVVRQTAERPMPKLPKAVPLKVEPVAIPESDDDVGHLEDRELLPFLQMEINRSHTRFTAAQLADGVSLLQEHGRSRVEMDQLVMHYLYAKRDVYAQAFREPELENVLTLISGDEEHDSAYLNIFETAVKDPRVIDASFDVLAFAGKMRSPNFKGAMIKNFVKYVPMTRAQARALAQAVAKEDPELARVILDNHLQN